MRLPLAYYGDAILRKKGEPVENINEEIRQLVQDMVETMIEHNGMGLAAPQIHKSIRLFITAVPVEQQDGTWLPGKLRVFINPEILSYSETTTVRSEGCLSIPGLHAEVERPDTIIVRAKDQDGNDFEEEFSGLDARTILHENDHINGVLYVDRIRGKNRKKLEPTLREIKKKYSSR